MVYHVALQPILCMYFQISVQDLQVYSSWLEHSYHNVMCWLSRDFFGPKN